MNYCELDILYQQSMLHTLELLSCLEYQFLAKTTKWPVFNETLSKSYGGDMQFLNS